MTKLPAGMASVLKNSGKRSSPLWEGPGSDGPNGGITQSLISRFLTCRERFRLYALEGLRSPESFNHKLEYGNLWHLAEQTYASCLRDPTTTKRWKDAVDLALQTYRGKLCKKHPLQQLEIDKWWNVCKVQFPIYVDHYQKEQDREKRKTVFEEMVFSVPYKLPSGRVVYIKGKWDGGQLTGSGKSQGVYLNEHKTKGDVDLIQLERQVKWDLQLGLYLTALEKEAPRVCHEMGHYGIPLQGAYYNVVRRPLSGGKHSISRKKATKKQPEETHEQFYQRVGERIRSDPRHFFARWKVDFFPGEIQRFQRETLIPVLEQMVDWWECVTGCSGDVWARCEKHGNVHYRHPYGSVNTIDEYGSSEVDSHLESGSMVGLRRTEVLFPELSE